MDRPSQCNAKMPTQSDASTEKGAVKVAADPVRAEKVVAVEADVMIAVSEASVLSVLAVADAPRRPRRSWTLRWRITLAERNRVMLQLPMALLQAPNSRLGMISI